MANAMLITLSLLSLISPTIQKVTLISSDGEAIEVDESIVSSSTRIKHFVNRNYYGLVGVPLPRVSGEILAKVVEYSEQHSELHKLIVDNTTHLAIEAQRLDEAFVSSVDNCTLFRLAGASTYLGMKGLQELAHRTVFNRAFDSMELKFTGARMNCWSVYGCVPSGGWVVVKDTVETDDGEVCQD